MHLVGILFPHINEDARSKSHQIFISSSEFSDTTKNQQNFQSTKYFSRTTKIYRFSISKRFLGTETKALSRQFLFTLHQNSFICRCNYNVLFPLFLLHALSCFIFFFSCVATNSSNEAPLQFCQPPPPRNTYTHKRRRYQRQVMLTNKGAGITKSNLMTNSPHGRKRKSVAKLVECGNATIQLLVLFALSNTKQIFDISDRPFWRLRSVQKYTDMPNIT